MLCSKKRELRPSLKFDTARKNASIIIVDSSRTRSCVYEKYFAMADLNVAAIFPSTGDALSFLTLLEKESDQPNNSVVLLDSEIAGRGELKAVRELKRAIPDQRVILALSEEPSALSSPDRELFDGFVFKPFTISELVGAIQDATSPLRIKGSRIFQNREEIERLFQDVLADSHEKICSSRNPAFVTQGTSVSEQLSAYLAARSRGLKVLLITEITRDNMFYCKQLMLNQGIQVRHLDGLRTDFIVWDEKHSVETVRAPAGSPEQVLYSNLEHIVGKNQYEFDALWSIARPAERIIRDLEAHQEKELEPRFSVLTGNDLVGENRTNLVRNARLYLYACIIPAWLGYLVKPDLLQAGTQAVSRGVQCRLLTEITKDSLPVCKKLIESGVEIRHLPNQKGAFALNEKEATVNAEGEDPTTSKPFSTIYSTYPNFVAQHRSIFNTLWQVATPASLRIRQLEIEQQEEEEEKEKEIKSAV